MSPAKYERQARLRADPSAIWSHLHRFDQSSRERTSILFDAVEGALEIDTRTAGLGVALICRGSDLRIPRLRAWDMVSCTPR